jgi:hypothetical protein
MTRRRFFWLALAALFLALGLIAAFEPTQTIRALIAGEDFFRWRPTRYWREVLRAEGQANRLTDSTFDTFRGSSAVPVLLACLADPDRNVRWPAAALLPRTGAPAGRLVAPLRVALRDPDIEVRLHAILSLGVLGANARAAVPDLLKLLRDPQAQVAHYADLALWQIDVPTAVKACGWKAFTSSRWGFTAMFPAAPEKKEGTIMGVPGTQLHSFAAFHKATHCVVAVAEYPEDYLKDSTEEERLDAARDLCEAGLGGKVVREVDIELQGHTGREVEIEVNGIGTLRTHLFWLGRRLYQVNVTLSERFGTPPAGEYFLESFRFTAP